MKTNILTINGSTYTAAMNFAVILAYETMTERPFDLTGLDKQSGILQLIYCILLANNDNVPDFNDFLRTITPGEFITANEAVAALINDWYNIPASAESHVEEPAEDSDDAKKA